MNCKCKYPNNELEPRMVCPKCGESEDGIRCEDCAYVASLRAKLDALVEVSCTLNTMLGYGISAGQDFHDVMMKFQDAITKARE